MEKNLKLLVTIVLLFIISCSNCSLHTNNKIFVVILRKEVKLKRKLTSSLFNKDFPGKYKAHHCRIGKGSISYKNRLDFLTRDYYRVNREYSHHSNYEFANDILICSNSPPLVF